MKHEQLESAIRMREKEAERLAEQLRSEVADVQRALQDGQRVRSSIGGEPHFAQTARDLEAALRARQLTYDLQAELA